MQTIIQKVKFQASPKELYDIFIDPRKHSEATGGKATGSGKVGGKFTAWNGYISGKHLGLTPGRTIVQSWRANEYKKGDKDSILILTFEKVKGGTELTMIHAVVPDHVATHFKTGWYESYWNPIKKYLMKGK
jgi:activator of HSP90 ATPase